MARIRMKFKFAPSSTYGKPHPGIPDAQEDALFAQSIYDAAPEHIRKKTHDDGGQVLFTWFYGRESDPRPFGERYKVPHDYNLPPFPWNNELRSFYDIFN